MNKSTLQIIYMTFVLVMLSLFIASSSLIEVGKLFLLVVLSYMLFELTTRRRGSSVYHHFNILFAITTIVFVIYALAYKGDLFGLVHMEFFLLSLIAFALSMMYTPRRRRVLLPPRPVKREVRAVKKTTSKKVVAKNKAPKRTVSRVVAKKNAKKNTKKATKRNISADRKRISFSKDHEVAYLLRKYKKRITKDNKLTIVSHGKKFKSLVSYKPHNRQKFYEYVKKYRVLSKLK